jgi:nucleotidyltransferase substrate binding protein (TIGR01987 family)
MNDKPSQSLVNLATALERLREALQEPEANKLAVDGTIQRFEFVFELYWKTLKRLLAWEGIQTQTPRETLQRAYQAGWLADETAWLQMLRDRSQTSHQTIFPRNGANVSVFAATVSRKTGNLARFRESIIFRGAPCHTFNSKPLSPAPKARSY